MFFRQSLRSLVILGFSLATLACLRAGPLTWERQSIDHDATPAETETHVTFPFRNTSDRAVTIVGLQPECGCTTATIAKKTYGPGERGEVGISIKLGDMVGLQVKRIAVTTDASPSGEDLVVRITIPTLVVIEPRLLFWNKGDTTPEKSIIISAGSTANINVLSARAVSAGIDSRIEIIEAGRKYRLVVRPGTAGEDFDSRVEGEVEIAGIGRRPFIAAVLRIAK
jgi:hypothetical protein